MLPLQRTNLRIIKQPKKVAAFSKEPIIRLNYRTRTQRL